MTLPGSIFSLVLSYRDWTAAEWKQASNLTYSYCWAFSRDCLCPQLSAPLIRRQTQTQLLTRLKLRVFPAGAIAWRVSRGRLASICQRRVNKSTRTSGLTVCSNVRVRGDCISDGVASFERVQTAQRTHACAAFSKQNAHAQPKQIEKTSCKCKQQTTTNTRRGFRLVLNITTGCDMKFLKSSLSSIHIHVYFVTRCH